jgi:hypothetical protein
MDFDNKNNARDVHHYKMRRIEEYKKNHGHVRQIIHTKFDDQRLVVVRNATLIINASATVHDFLFEYIKHVLGHDWMQAESVKPKTEKHQILQWNEDLAQLLKKNGAGSDSLKKAIPDGAAKSYLSLAWDLFSVDDNALLQQGFINRLKQNEQFQGARYELFAAATCIRAGFKLDYEAVEDTSKKQPEFVGTHKEKGQIIAVEAKSRHRPGVLGFRGEQEDPEKVKVEIRRLLKGALKKEVVHPYVIFIDINMPPGLINETSPLLQEVYETLNDPIYSEGRYRPWNMVILTNHPYHYGTKGEPSPKEDPSLFHLSGNPQREMESPGTLDEIRKRVNQFGDVPSHFPEE